MPSSYWECAQFAMGASLLSPAQGSLRAPLLEWGARPARLGAMPPRAKGAAARSRSGPPRTGAQQWRETAQEQRDAGAELMKKFLELFATTKLSAKDLCTLSWLCDRAQVPGAPFGLYALHPSSDSGNFSRHIDKVLHGWACVRLLWCGHRRLHRWWCWWFWCGCRLCRWCAFCVCARRLRVGV